MVTPRRSVEAKSGFRKESSVLIVLFGQSDTLGLGASDTQLAAQWLLCRNTVVLQRSQLHRQPLPDSKSNSFGLPVCDLIFLGKLEV